MVKWRLLSFWLRWVHGLNFSILAMVRWRLLPFDCAFLTWMLNIISYAAGPLSAVTGKMSAQVPLLSLNWVTKHFATELWKFFKYFGNIPYQVCGWRMFPCILQAAFSFCWLTDQLGFCGLSRSWRRNHCHDGCRTPLLLLGQFQGFYLQAFNQCQVWVWCFVCLL